ncbi:Disease resistance protein [Dorcoceras hygrometricum]|uniref:Disease resistance protein n=1 Tax=Dorcoceras hygrometricum TaxID=472368 RepID=A0A2Z7C203_9LAMI|nr:Disease resistance protein [Dorcoceras hygrometricum]
MIDAPINHLGTRGPSNALQANSPTTARESPEDQHYATGPIYATKFGNASRTHSIFTKLFPRPHYQLGSVFGGPCPDMLKHFLKRRRTWAGLCGRRAHDLTHVSAERASKPLHLPSPSINTTQVCSFKGTLSFSHTFALTAHNSPSFLSGTPPDLGIGGPSPDSPPAPSDLCLWLQEPRRSTFHLLVPDARAPSPDVVVALRLTKFGYIKYDLVF